MRKQYFKLKMKVADLINRITLLRVANIRLDFVGGITKDEHKLMQRFIELCMPSQVITRGGRAIYRLKALEEVTLWSILETRRADDSKGRIHAWTEGDYEPDILLDCIKADKYIIQCLKDADELESIIFRNINTGGGDGDSDPIKEAKNLLGLVQITAELFHCSFEEAKKVNYSDAMLAIAKRHEEIEKEKQQLKKQSR